MIRSSFVHMFSSLRLVIAAMLNRYTMDYVAFTMTLCVRRCGGGGLEVRAKPCRLNAARADRLGTSVHCEVYWL